MEFSGMDIRYFINYIVGFDEVDDILNKAKTQSEKGFIFERLFDIVIKFGFCDIFKNSCYEHVIGNTNLAKLKILKNLNKYLCGNVISGKSGGCSDITLRNKNDHTYIFISSKYPKTSEEVKKQKSVYYYDIQNIIAMAKHNKHLYKKYRIYLVVPDKNLLLKKIKQSNKTSEYLTNYVNEETVMDKSDLNKYFKKFKQSIIQNLNGDWQNLYGNRKDMLELRFHQELITQKTHTLINQGHKSFLWGCKCRSGKTYMIGGLIVKQKQEKQKLNVLIITPAPKETSSQFADDLFAKYKNFDDFKIHEIKNSKMFDNLKIEKNNIFIISKQLLQRHINKNTIEKLKNLQFDMIGFDENHYGGTTELSKSILRSYSTENTVKIYLTATYFKPLAEWMIANECQMYWDIEDEQICKSIIKDEKNITKLKEKHGENFINDTLTYYASIGNNVCDVFKNYLNMPDLHLITTIFDNERYEDIKKRIVDSNYGFSFDTLFSLNNKKKFNYPDEIKLILRYISGSNKEVDYKLGDNSIFTRINKISSRRCFTQIWFLPSNGINLISKNLKNLMLEDTILKKYNILCINSKNDSLDKNIKDDIINQEIMAKSQNKKGLILLAGNMLSLGITIDNCDIVVMLNNTLSSDKIVQQMYRCMTEGDDKNYGFVVDLNISRVVQTCATHITSKISNNVEDKVKYVIENHLINIDLDMLKSKNLNSEQLIKKLMKIWNGDPINAFRTLMRRLDNEYIIFDNPTQKLINNFFEHNTKTKNVKLFVEFKNDNDELQQLPKGKEIIANNENLVNHQDEKKEEINISFTKEILPYIIPLSCILTLKDNNKDFVKMLNDIKKNKELMQIFNDQCFILWKREGVIDVVKNIVDKYFNECMNTLDISVHFKMSLQSLLEKPNKLLELIDNCLKPQDIEKRNFGEVFTPLKFINDDMLKSIEEYWLKVNKENIWENEKIMWYDPAAGMGNFPVALYYKLMRGLKKKIPNKKNRSKHILENQLFMSELNKKNCFLLKQILNIDNNTKLNLYEGDSLTIDINQVFDVDKFDVIIGNPPYNEKLTKIGAKPLYNKFIEYYIDKCNYMSFVVPSRWFSGGKGLGNFREMMMKRSDISYIKHFDDACKIFGNNVDIKGGVNYFLIDKNYDGLCNFNDSVIDFKKYDIIVESKYYDLIDKLKNYKNITEIYLGRCFGIESNDKRLKDTYNSGDLKCYVSKQKGFIKYINSDEIKKKYNYYKVITPEAAHKGNSGFGNIFIGDIDEIHSGSYVSFKVKTKDEAKALQSYFKCKMPNFLLSLRKITHHTNNLTCKWIPLPPLDRIWTNGEVYEHYNLSKDDIKLIEEANVIGYKCE